jgi:hypothetical protein
MTFNQLVNEILAAGQGKISENEALACANQCDRAYYDEVDPMVVATAFIANAEAQMEALS